MTDETNHPMGQEPTLHAETAASDSWQPTDYSIDPDDQHIADQIDAMDPFSYPSTVTVKGAVRISAPKLDALTGPMRDKAREKLANIPIAERAEAESKVVMEVLQENRQRLKVATGLPADALPVHKEALDISREVRALNQEFMANVQWLDQVEWESEIDPVTGENRPKAVPIHGPAARHAREVRQAEILHHLRQLVDEDGNHGPEAARRIAKARKESVELVKGRNAAKAESDEVRVRTDDAIREERIKKRVEVAVRNRRHEL